MRKLHLCLLALMACCSTACFSQDSLLIPLSDTAFYYYRICKQPEAFLIRYPLTRATRTAVQMKEKVRKELFALNGELGYQRFSRSSPSDDLLLINSSSDIVTFQAGMIFKETYPVTLRVRYNEARPFQLDNQYEVSISFDDREFRQLLQERMKGKLTMDFYKKQQDLMKQHDQLFRQYQAQRQYLQSPAYLQQQLEDQLKSVAAAKASLPDSLPSLNEWSKMPASLDEFKKRPGAVKSLASKIPALKEGHETIDSVIAKVMAKKESLHKKMQSKRDSIQGLMENMEDSIGQLKVKLQQALDSLAEEMAALKSPEEIKRYADKKKLIDSLPSSKWSSFLMKTQLRFGKFIMNQSELTVSNIFIRGASIRYGNERFIMLSAGAYDFSFRNLFSFRNDSLRGPIPSVYALKFGRMDGNNLTAFNIYTGRKTRTASLQGELRTVAGFSIERKMELNRNFTATVELAKSTTKENTAGSKQEAVLKDLFGGISSKTIALFGSLKATLPKTKTDAEVTYKYWGQQFESFNASQYFNPQNNLSAKVSQPFFKRKLYAMAGIRYTDFRTSGIANNIKTRAFFASTSATLRLKRMPVITLGYYPGSQLYMMDRNTLYEYYYYVLNATVSHQFSIGQLPVQGVYSYSRFFNKYTDSLVSNSNSSHNLFWTAWKNRFTYSVNLSRQELEQSLLYTVESGLQYSTGRFKLGGALKWNKINGVIELGYSGTMGWSIGKIGTISVMYDRSYLPDRTGRFIPIETAQLQLIKPLNFKIWQ